MSFLALGRDGIRKEEAIEVQVRLRSARYSGALSFGRADQLSMPGRYTENGGDTPQSLYGKKHV